MTTTTESPVAPEAERVAEPAPRPTNVIEALARCIAEMPAIGKDQQMGNDGSSQSYKYRSIEAVTSHASALFGRHCVVVKPHKIKRAVREIPMGNGRTVWTEDLLRVKYRIYGPGGRKDHITTGWLHALARDNSDKGTNKAMTQAYKQMLLQVLVVGDNKDDPDSYSPLNGQPERQAGHEQTIEEWSLSNGWDSNEQRLTAHRHVRAAIKAEVDAQRIDPGGAQSLWDDYKRPEGQEGPRTWGEHAAWMGHYLPNHPILPEAAQSPTEAPTPQPEPEPAASPETPVQPAEEPAQPTLAEQPPDMAEPEPAAADEPPDNGYRSAADGILQDAGPDELFKYLTALPIPDVVRELASRGVEVAGTHKPEELRRRLGSIVVARKRFPDAQAPEPPAQEPKQRGRQRRD